jgi:hypothetical protein
VRHAARAREQLGRVVPLLGEAPRAVPDVLVQAEDLRNDQDDRMAVAARRRASYTGTLNPETGTVKSPTASPLASVLMVCASTVSTAKA